MSIRGKGYLHQGFTNVGVQRKRSPQECAHFATAKPPARDPDIPPATRS